MCGRYTLIKLAELLEYFPWVRSDLPGPRYNIAPSQAVLAITNQKPDQFELLRWGLVPAWAKDPAIGNRMINARAETLADKPSFRTALRNRRCLVPADGFYEWRKEPHGGKTPMLIRMRSGKPFAFAGLWDDWKSADGQIVRSCTIITTPPNSLLAPIHNRMPAIMPATDYLTWLNGPDPQSLLEPFDPGAMEAFAVSAVVNSPRADSPECICPANAAMLF